METINHIVHRNDIICKVKVAMIKDCLRFLFVRINKISDVKENKNFKTGLP